MGGMHKIRPIQHFCISTRSKEETEVQSVQIVLERERDIPEIAEEGEGRRRVAENLPVCRLGIPPDEAVARHRRVANVADPTWQPTRKYSRLSSSVLLISL